MVTVFLIFTNPIFSNLGVNRALISLIVLNEDENEDEDEDNVYSEDNDESNAKPNNINFSWEYTLVNGFFSDEVEVTKASKQEITKSLNEVARFIEKTIARDYINDFSETKNLQRQILDLYDQDNLDRLDICIVTDKIIDQETLETSVRIKNTNIIFQDSCIMIIIEIRY